MEFLSILLIAIGLSFDSFAVSISCGLILKNIKFNQAIRFAFALAFFQGLLPIAGWFIGFEIKDYVEEFDHWIAFVLLALIGGKMILESFKADEQKCFDPMKLKVMIGMGLATSIDAFIVGIGLAFFQLHILISVAIIASVTFIISMLGMLFGKKTSGKFGKKMETLGGIILILIGVKILLEHLFLN